MLSGGIWKDSVCYREAGLRPITGDDEDFLLSFGEESSTAQRVTALLTRCLTRLPPLEAVTRQAVRSLTVGDREALLLQLMRLTTGDRMVCIVTCPHTSCGEKMDLDLAIDDLLLPPYDHAQATFRRSCAANGDSFDIHFRLPTGADQEAVANLARRCPEDAAASLLERCIIDIKVNGKETETTLPESVFFKLSEAMAKLDPQAELVLNLNCPYCYQAFSTALDMGTFIYEEIEGRSRSLYREVHLLAWHYHWSEADILGMTADRRRRYLELLSESLQGGATP
jgi:hypothetical protein